ncbi:MAG: 50S ribosomal protein L23 [Parachlamydiales bacterium]|nr:50S ribosomal protein L23 [Parachlamydiales bacterium]
MKKRNPFDIIKSRRMTEKTNMLANLAASQSNACVRKCTTPKVVFLVNVHANKKEIAWAIEEIYKDRKIKVKKVNTILVKPKERRVRGHLGMTKMIKKAIVSLQAGDSIEEAV